ncbi:MAG: 50S ribosomal protein L11 methyltransferase [Fulvivirga sp.]
MKSTQYIEVKFTCTEAFKEILIAELYASGFDSMMETDEGVDAYVLVEEYDAEVLNQLTEKYKKASISYSTSEFENKNWNEEWEKNYDPIVVEDKCLVRATFHESFGNYPYEIIITPKMSFGTGHHSTTYLMLKHQMGIDHKGKRVLDAGCGTAILAVMAEKLGAKEVIAYDIDDWSIENAPENVALNDCQNIQVLGGTIDTIDLKGEFDIILANINKNVLLDEMGAYSKFTKSGGTVVLSGFYTHDNDDLVTKASKVGLELVGQNEKSDWSSLIFVKN